VGFIKTYIDMIALHKMNVFRIWVEDGCGIMEMSFMVIAWVWSGGRQLKRIKLNRVNIIFIFK